MKSKNCELGFHGICEPCECPCHKQWQQELLDLITLMPDSQTQEIIDYIMQLKEIRGRKQ